MTLLLLHKWKRFKRTGSKFTEVVLRCSLGNIRSWESTNLLKLYDGFQMVSEPFGRISYRQVIMKDLYSNPSSYLGYDSTLGNTNRIFLPMSTTCWISLLFSCWLKQVLDLLPLLGLYVWCLITLSTLLFRVKICETRSQILLQNLWYIYRWFEVVWKD